MSKVGIKKLLLVAFLGLTSIPLAACSKTVYHTVYFDTAGSETILDPVRVKHGECVNKPLSIKRKGYNLNSWQKDSEEWNFRKYPVLEDMTLVAKWDIITYNINYGFDERVMENNPANPSSFTVEDGIIDILPAIMFDGTFEYWYDAYNSQKIVTQIDTSNIGDISLSASYSTNSHRFHLSVNASSYTWDYIFHYGDLFDFEEPIRSAPKELSFDGIYVDGTKIESDIHAMYALNFKKDIEIEVRFFL